MKFLKASLIFVSSAALLVCGVFAFRWLRDNKLPNFTRTAEVYVYPETTAEEALEMISDEAGVRSRRSLERMFRKKHVSQHITTGHYTVSPSNPSVYVARMLNNGWQTPVKVTLSGNLRIKGNIAAKVASQLLVDSATVRRAFDDDKLLSRYGFDSGNMFALLMPATYEMYWTASVEDFLDRQKQAYDAFWTSVNDAKAETLGLSRLEVSTLASIVDAETNHEEEMSLIAGVYLNRLRLGMPLQADPTVAFCFDYKLTRVLNKHLQVDSPYNTYKYPGLPPGPICVPSRAALEAVLNPDYGGAPGRGNLFFCANPDFSGTHVFARTLSEHNRNAAAYRRALASRD